MRTSTPHDVYGHSTTGFSPDFLALPELAPPPTPPHAAANYFLQPPPMAVPAYELNSVYDSSSGGYDSPGYSGNRSVVISNNEGLFNSSPTELFESEVSSSSVTRVFGAGDLQGTNVMQYLRRSESPFSSKNNSFTKSMNKTCRYSTKERKERIERYRSKKNQRNFNKKIKYVCRKTLADSRPRIRGRFVRNDEINNTSNECRGEEQFDDEDVDKWMFNFPDSFSSNLIS